MKEQFPARMLRIHFTEADKWQGEPLYKAIVANCQELGLAGATVYRGLEGFGASARIYHARSLSFSKDAPIMVSVIDTEGPDSKADSSLGSDDYRRSGCQFQCKSYPLFAIETRSQVTG